MKNRGYYQAAQNVAWEIFKVSEESEQAGESPEDMVVAALDDPEKRKFWDDLDRIILSISTIYDVSLPEIQQDVLVEIMTYHFQRKSS